MKLKLVCLIILLSFVLVGCGHEVVNQNVTERDFSSNYQSFIEKSEEYLISKYGVELFEEAITFVQAIPVEMNIRENQRGNVIVVEYNLDFKKYVDYESNLNEVMPFIRLHFTEDGELFRTYGIIDCKNHPEYCPHYQINNKQEAITKFKEVCNENFDEDKIYPEDKPVVFSADDIFYEVDFSIHNIGNKLPSGEVRPGWNFQKIGLSPGSTGTYGIWSVYIDPQTGEIIREHPLGICS